MIIPVEREAYDLLHNGVLELSRIESVGMRIDVGRLRRSIKEVKERIVELELELKKSREWKVWEKCFGERSNMGSRYQLGVILFKKLGYRSRGVTATGRPRTDEESLSEVDSPFVRKYLELEKLKKLLNTYLRGIEREVVDGYLHPSFNLHLVKTYRSSCEMPNFQNIPIRDEEVGRLVRSCFVPRPGHVLVECDYGALEFRVAACVSGDTEVLVRLEGETGGGSFVKIRDLVERISRGEHFETFGFYLRVCGSGWYKILDGGLTRRNAVLWRVIFDNGKILEATSDHKVMMIDGSFKRIEDLKEGDEVYPAGSIRRPAFFVRAVEKNVKEEDVYNLTVDLVHNYATSAGVFVSNCFWRDEEMIKYASDPSKDIHRDMAAKCFILPVEEVDKKVRFYAKNQFVFPELYGSYYGSCARNLWKFVPQLELASGVSMVDHLRSKGIYTLVQFEEHLKGVEEYFNKVFSQWSRRKEKWCKKYQECGWFRMMTGFVCQGVFTRNELYNWPIQGPAFHCLLWSLIQLNRWLREKRMKSVIVGQIHDSIVADVHKEELEDYLAKAREVMTVDLRRNWRWVIVPMVVEAEIAEENWFEKRPV